MRIKRKGKNKYKLLHWARLVHLSQFARPLRCHVADVDKKGLHHCISYYVLST
jgi:hypothetical protein